MNKASDTVEQASRSANHYAYALRCIGQSLEGADLKSMEVRTHGDDFIVHGWSKKASNAVDVERRYSTQDIEQLDHDNKERRKQFPLPPNLLSLSHVLRFCGSYVDRLRGRLTRVSWQDQSDKIQSITIQFEPFEERRNEKADAQGATIEELYIHVYKQRKKISSGVEKPWNRPSAGAFNGL